jgi:hypothetical protein
MNKYFFRFQFGDGKPKEICIESKNVVAAVDAGYKQYPAARNLHLVSILSDNPVKQPVVPDLIEDSHPLFGDKPQFSKRVSPEVQEKIKEAVALRWKGLTFYQISKQMGVSANMVTRWVTEYV